MGPAEIATNGRGPGDHDERQATGALASIAEGGGTEEDDMVGPELPKAKRRKVRLTHLAHTAW